MLEQAEIHMYNKAQKYKISEKGHLQVYCFQRAVNRNVDQCLKPHLRTFKGKKTIIKKTFKYMFLSFLPKEYSKLSSQCQ